MNEPFIIRTSSLPLTSLRHWFGVNHWITSDEPPSPLIDSTWTNNQPLKSTINHQSITRHHHQPSTNRTNRSNRTNRTNRPSHALPMIPPWSPHGPHRSTVVPPRPASVPWAPPARQRAETLVPVAGSGHTSVDGWVGMDGLGGAEWL